MNEEHRSEQEQELDLHLLLHNFLHAAKRLIWFVLPVVLIVGALTYVRTDRAYQPLYSSSAVFSVKACYSASTDITSNSPYFDSNAAVMLSQTFPYIIGSENTQLLLKDALDLPYIPGSVSAYSTAESALFTMIATGSDPQLTYDLLNAAIAVYPQAASSILGDTQIDVINKPMTPPTAPINQNTAMNTAVKYSVITFVLGLAVIFLISLTRKTVHSAEDLRRLVNLKCFGYVPFIRPKKHSERSSAFITITNPRLGSAFNEAIRSICGKLQRTLATTDAHVLMITSTLPGEGKTTVATNLALSLAAAGKRVILIDGDLRKQSLKQTLGVRQSSDGLVEVLSGKSQNFRLLNIPNSTLLLLSGDETTDRPQPLLDTPRMRQILTLLRGKLDYIIIDTPPAGVVSDAATIAKFVDATLYVVRQDMANTSQILGAIQTLASCGVNLTGCVLNRTQAGTTRYGYGSKYAGYGYGYGYRYGSYGYGAKCAYDEKATEAAQSLTDTIKDAAEADGR